LFWRNSAGRLWQGVGICATALVGTAKNLRSTFAAETDAGPLRWTAFGWLANRSSFKGGGTAHLRGFHLRRSAASADESPLRWATSACNHERRLVDLGGGSWNRMAIWLRWLDGLSRVSERECA